MARPLDPTDNGVSYSGNETRFARNRLQQAASAHIIPRQHMPTDAVGLISLYHSLSPRIAHALNQGATLGGAHPRPLPAPMGHPAPMHYGATPASQANSTPAPEAATTLPAHVNYPGAPLDFLLQALGGRSQRSLGEGY
jgi:hypothetical protein